MGQIRNLVGQRFGRLVVQRLAEISKQGAMWACQCDCGTAKVVWTSHLTGGRTKSCGCLLREVSARLIRERSTTHGRSKSPEYRSWRSMIGRCENPNDQAFGKYGGRGIAVCERWRVFENFLADMGDRPTGTSIERKDNDGPYEPENCVWGTPAEQSLNRRITRFVDTPNGPVCLTHAAKLAGLSAGCLAYRLDAGMSFSEAAAVKPHRGARLTDSTH